MPLNKNQMEAMTDVIDFINDPNRKYHYVSGDAGTGKTFFLAEIVKKIRNYIQPNIASQLRIAVTATTNKAAAVIEEALNDPQFKVSTTHSFMNLKIQENYNTGEVKCTPSKNWRIHSHTLVIVDESPMVNRALKDYIEKGTDKTCKVLYIGDVNQLAPVKEPVSQVFTSGYSFSTLTEKVRNAGSPALMALCAQAKKTVETGIFTPIKPVPGVIHLIDGGEQLKGVLESEYAQEDLHKRVLSYTNRRVKQYNHFIRQVRGYTEPFVEGEFVNNNHSAALIDNPKLLSTDKLLEIGSINDIYDDPDIIKGHTFRVVKMTVKDEAGWELGEVTCFYDSEERTAVLKHYQTIAKKNRQWFDYFAIKKNYPDLRSSAASTTHKAQGSTYDSVVVDLADIGTASNLDQIARMQYVALSRPKHKIFIRGQLPDRVF